MANMIQKAAAETAVTKKKQPSTIKDYIEVMAPAIKAALPSVMNPSTIHSVFFNCFNKFNF